MIFNSMKGQLLQFIVIDFVVVALVVLLFKNIPHKTAGTVAAFLFITQSIYFLATIIKWNNFQKFYSFHLAIVHLFMGTIPILMIRLAYWSTPFNEIQMGYIKGTHLHNWSELIYLCLIISHLVDLKQLKNK